MFIIVAYMPVHTKAWSNLAYTAKYVCFVFSFDVDMLVLFYQKICRLEATKPPFTSAVS